jgi:hypothetical protein
MAQECAERQDVMTKKKERKKDNRRSTCTLYLNTILKAYILTVAIDRRDYK